MRAGKLDQLVTILRWDNEPEPDDYGAVTPAWVKFADMRAQIVQAATEEFMRNGAVELTAVVFRIRFIEGVTTAHRIEYGGTNHDIKEIKILGRRQGLEIRALARGAE